MKKHGLSGRNTIETLADSPILNELSGPELAVYIRLLAMVERQKTSRVRAQNVDLHRNRGGRTAQDALDKLEKKGYVRVKIEDRGWENRAIEVL